jgi:hypothetical protein
MTPYRECGETLPIINKPKHPKKRGNTRSKMKGSMFKKTKKPPKTNHKGNIKNIKFLNPQPIVRSLSNQMRKVCDLLKGCHYNEGFSSEEATCEVASSYLK